MEAEGDNTSRKHALGAALAAYDSAVRDSAIPEREVNARFSEAEELVPHARLGDLVFYGEVERTREQIIEEALYRERLWERGGDLEVLLHMRRQMTKVIEDPAASKADMDFASDGLEDISKEIETLRGHES